MKTSILILALFCFSFSLESAQSLQHSTFEDNSEVIKIRNIHFIGAGDYIVLEVPLNAVAHHLSHGDSFECAEPPLPC